MIVLERLHFLHDLVWKDIQTVVEMGLMITQELDVLDGKCVVGANSGCTICSCCIKTDGFVMGDAVTEDLDVLQFVINGSLSKTFCPPVI